MLRGLRLRLTLLYLLAALALLVLVGGGAYGLLAYYFQVTTDQALQHKMAVQFRALAAPLPSELEAADRAWYAERNLLQPTPSAAVPSAQPNGEHSEAVEQSGTEGSGEAAYDSEQASIFVSLVRTDGTLVSSPNLLATPSVYDTQAMVAALAYGHDWRTVRLGSGARVRLLTYRVVLSQGPAVLQAARTLSDQDQLLNQLMLGLLGLGGLCALFLGAASWWLAGRSLIPAQQAWERQQAFVANASHELRTPLTLMRASAEVARRSLGTGDERRGLLDDVIAETDHMGRLVEDLLLLSRLDAGRLRLEHAAIALPDMLGEVQRQVGRVAEERGVTLQLQEAQGMVNGDPTRLRQVLLILLDNALRHTPRGGAIRLGAQLHGRLMSITVADTGNGIAPTDLPHVFERFYQADRAHSSRANGGSGLGLAIAKALVEAQHGRIQIESQVGQGTLVSVTLPAAAA